MLPFNSVFTTLFCFYFTDFSRPDTGFDSIDRLDDDWRHVDTVRLFLYLLCILGKFSCSTQLSIKFIMLINVKMPTIVGILTFISKINTTSECYNQEKIIIFQYFSFNEQLKFHEHSVEMSMRKVPGWFESGSG